MRAAWQVIAGALLALLLAGLRRAAAQPQFVGPAPEFVGPVQDDAAAQGVQDDAAAARRNRAAFLACLRYAEGTDDAQGYRALYGHTKARPRLFSSFARHPVESGEWKGDKLSDVQCRGAGLGAGCITTAAGAYQMTLPTWTRMRQALSLPDFGPASQDQAALRLIADAGALADVDAGRFEQAIARVRRVWASLPGAGYAGQPERSLAALTAVYAAAGGAFA